MNKSRFASYIRNPWELVFSCLWSHPWLSSDKTYLKVYYRCKFNRALNLRNPSTFNEKLQWLKLYDRRPEYTVMVDKLEAKRYVAGILGWEYVIPTLGVWDSPDEIDFDSLPDQFVLKCTHNSGIGMCICRSKDALDIPSVKAALASALAEDYYLRGREWPYKNVRRRIIAEQYMSDDTPQNRGGLSDYKFTCFNGVADNVMVCVDRDKGDTKFYFFDRAWNLLRLNKRGLAAPEGFTLPKPALMDRMFEIASRLSEGIPYVRVDLYFVRGKIYFGELTFYPESGFDTNLLPQTDVLFGSKIVLPHKVVE